MKYASLEISFQRLRWVSPTILSAQGCVTRQFARGITFTLQRTPPGPSFFESRLNATAKSDHWSLIYLSKPFSPSTRITFIHLFLNRKHQDFRLKPSIDQSMIQPCTARKVPMTSLQRPWTVCYFFNESDSMQPMEVGLWGNPTFFPLGPLATCLKMGPYGLLRFENYQYLCHPPPLLRSRLVIEKNWANCRRIPKSWIEVIF